MPNFADFIEYNFLFAKPKKLISGCCDTLHNDIQHNDTQHNDTQYNDIQHKNNKIAALSTMTFSIMAVSLC
jgi:hypothetical protein